MSAATITFGKTIQSREDCLGYRHSWTPVLANGVPVGTIHKDQGRHGTRYVILDHNGKKIQNSDTKASISFLAEKVYIPHPTKPGKMRRVGDDWQTARRNAKAFAKEHFAAIEMPEVIVTDDQIFIRGELVGSIARKDQSRRTAWLDRLDVVTINGVTYEASPARSRDLAIEKATEAAQAETVEAEEPAQAFAPGDAVIATYKGAQTRGVIVCEYVCPDHRKGYPDERFYSSPEDPVYVVQERGGDQEIAYRASQLERCLEAHA